MTVSKKLRDSSLGSGGVESLSDQQRSWFIGYDARIEARSWV